MRSPFLFVSSTDATDRKKKEEEEKKKKSRRKKNGPRIAAFVTYWYKHWWCAKRYDTKKEKVDRRSPTTSNFDQHVI